MTVSEPLTGAVVEPQFFLGQIPRLQDSLDVLKFLTNSRTAACWHLRFSMLSGPEEGEEPRRQEGIGGKHAPTVPVAPTATQQESAMMRAARGSSARCSHTLFTPYLIFLPLPPPPNISIYHIIIIYLCLEFGTNHVLRSVGSRPRFLG